MTIIIGLAGLSQSGKSEVARILQEERDAEIVSFADPIKDLLVEMDPQVGLTCQEWIADFAEERGMSPREAIELTKNDNKNYETRELLQRLGVGARKIVGEDVWVDAWARSVGPMDSDTPIVVPDVRFANEVRALRKFSTPAKVWGIRRPGLVAGEHESEKLGWHVQDGVPIPEGLAFKNCTVQPWWVDTLIDNDSDLDDLRAVVLEQFDRAVKEQWQ